jgi:Holliday junction resolvase
MSNPNGAKGRKFERDIVEYLRANDLAAEKLPRTGRNDQGDGYHLRWEAGKNSHYVMWEAKAESRIDLSGYLRERDVERANFMKARNLASVQVQGIVVVKRRMASIGNCYVVQTVDDYFGIGDWNARGEYSGDRG